MNLRTVLLALLALSLATGCNLLKKAPPPEALQVDAAPAVEEVPAIPEPDGGLAEPTAEEGESTAAADALLEQMKAGGLTAEGDFKKTGAKVATSYAAKNCIEGKLEGIPVLMCEYADADGAKAGKTKLEDWAKDMTTGVVERNGKTLCTAKSNKDLDKNNDKVNKIITAFTKAK
jgi:hypothetical protein